MLPSSRLLSFSKAAVELHVNTAVISRQIKQLKAHLGLRLFRRLTRHVESERRTPFVSNGTLLAANVNPFVLE